MAVKKRKPVKKTTNRKPVAKKKVTPKKKTPVKKKSASDFSIDEKGQYSLRNVKTPQAIALWPFVFGPTQSFKARVKAKKGVAAVAGTDDFEYKIEVVFPKTDRKWKGVIATCKTMFKKVYPKHKGEIPLPFKDGDDKYDDDPEANAIYEGCYYMNARISADKEPPIVTDKENEEFLNKSDFYAGCHVKLVGTFATYLSGKNKGVTFYWDGVQKVDDGERLGFSKKKTFDTAKEIDV